MNIGVGDPQSTEGESLDWVPEISHTLPENLDDLPLNQKDPICPYGILPEPQALYPVPMSLSKQCLACTPTFQTSCQVNIRQPLHSSTSSRPIISLFVPILRYFSEPQSRCLQAVGLKLLPSTPKSLPLNRCPQPAAFKLLHSSRFVQVGRSKLLCSTSSSHSFQVVPFCPRRTYVGR